MAGTYFNPNNMLDVGWKPTGALGGYLAGLQGSYSLANADRSLRDQDLAHQEEQLKYDESLKDVPINDQARGLKSQQLQTESDLFDDGTAQRVRRQVLEGQGALGDSQVTKSKQEQMVYAGEVLNRFSESIKNEKPSALDQQFWDHWRNKAKAAGIKMPTNFGPKEIERIHAAAAAARNDLATMRQREAGDIANTRSVENQGRVFGQQKELQSQQDTAAMERERVKAAAAQGRAETMASSRLSPPAKTEEQYLLQVIKGDIPREQARQQITQIIDIDLRKWLNEAGGIETISPPAMAAKRDELTRKWVNLLYGNGSSSAPAAGAPDSQRKQASQLPPWKEGATAEINGKKVKAVIKDGKKGWQEQ